LAWLALVAASTPGSGQDLARRQPSPQVPADAPAVTVAPGPQEANPTAKPVYEVRPGPWGRLEYYYTYLHATTEQVEAMQLPSRTTTWVFRAPTEQDLRQAIQRIFPEHKNLDWLDDGRRIQKGAGESFRVSPPADFCKALTEGERSALAQVLRMWPENRFYAHPMVIESGDPAAWLTDAGLEASSVELGASLCYRIGGTWLFSDLPLVLSETGSRGQEKRLMRAMSRTRTLILRLHIDQSQDLRQLSSYWSNGNRKALLPILESVLETRGVERLDVAHLLPPLPRMLLYTYPTEDMAVAGRYPDCNWTSLNFFRRWPDAGFLGDGALTAALARDYAVIATPPLRLGDILVLVASGSQMALHSCVYVAGDIVFTKNGVGLASPWILMRMKDLRARYDRFGALETVAYRRND